MESVSSVAIRDSNPEEYAYCPVSASLALAWTSQENLYEEFY